MDNTAQWPQEIVVKTMEETSLERRATKARNEQALNCPRCNSTNTKFCYYNNYSLSQPRHFCKACKRYWTAGGSLRNIPVGGCSRKNKRSSSRSSSSSKNKLPDLVQVLVPPQNFLQSSSSSSAHDHQNPKIHETQDLNLSFPPTHDFKTLSQLIHVPNFDSNKNYMPTTSSSSHHQPSALELLTGVSASRSGLNPFMPMPITDPNMIYSSGFSLQEYKPTLNFSLDGLGIGTTGYGGLQGVQESSSGRHLFPFKDHSKQVSNNTIAGGGEHNNREQRDSNGYWNGMLGGGSWI